MAALYSAVVYATIEDLDNSAPPKSLIRCQPTDKLRALAQASRIIDTFLAARYQLPLATWDDDLTQWCCQIAVYRLLTVRGWNPTDIANSGIVTLYREAMACLRSVKGGDLTLNVTTTAPDPTYQPDAASQPMRGI
jgi:phage gp36-like protein